MKHKFWLTNFCVVSGPPYTSWSKRAEESNRASGHLGDPCRWAQVVLWIPNWHREKEEFWKLVKPHDWRQTRRENYESIMVEVSHLNRLLIGPWVIINSRWLSFYCDYGKAILYRWSKTLPSQEYFLSIYLHLGYWGIKGKNNSLKGALIICHTRKQLCLCYEILNQNASHPHMSQRLIQQYFEAPLGAVLPANLLFCLHFQKALFFCEV